MLSINTNLSSLIAQNSLNNSTNILNQAVERMSTGYKINHAKDNAANYSISTNMTTKIGAYQVAEDNAAMGLDMLNTASENLSQVEIALSRIRALAIQASNGTYGIDSKQAINSEVNALVDEIGKTLGSNEYNGVKITNSEETRFIKDIVRRDTSNMKPFKEVKSDEVLEEDVYSISSPEELAKLAEMTNNGLIGTKSEFVLASDIDLKQYSNWTPIGYATYGGGDNSKVFRGKFDGNGYVISNLTIDSTADNDVGLFGKAIQSEFVNLGLENVNIKSLEENTASLLGAGNTIKIDNCYATGSIKGVKYNTGGLLGYITTANLFNSYTKVNIEGNQHVGGFAAALYKATVENCFAESNITSVGSTGGFCGVTNTGKASFTDCYVKIGSLSGTSSCGGFIGSMNSATPEILFENCFVESESTLGAFFITSATGENVILKDCQYKIKNPSNNIEIIKNNSITGDLKVENLKKVTSQPYPILTRAMAFDKLTNGINLQIGISNDTNSQINFNTSFSSEDLSELRYIGLKDLDFLNIIDKNLSKISNKQTELGSVSNRLESVLDEISTQYENLVSSRSTLRDADIAKESSTYIQQQILQQASATLLATANQSPAIALQLI